MISEIKNLETTILKPLNLSISDIVQDLECEDYFGYDFTIGRFNVKFRKAKITPKKIGKFVTLWKRNVNGKTEPFNITDDFDFYIISAIEKQKSGFFFFPKNILENHQILTSNKKAGKLGFRVYTNWDFPDSKQAIKTKFWQGDYFIDLENNTVENLKKFKNILSS
ncbi:MepB family protein [Halpernia frigidisoli]|uniref:MepB protein n=1 Tax=Halpernia frigidisoli TaxID=1125876 RepID=A0A1I3I679_9FLAO|nr:MepB family protein [Halpernia frigidisoli]SFI43422.1 hypothetical protein SAMN05443292_2582 [Halpernia frigidisoli]